MRKTEIEKKIRNTAGRLSVRCWHSLDMTEILQHLISRIILSIRRLHQKIDDRYSIISSLTSSVH